MPSEKRKIALIALGTNLPYRGLSGAALLDAAIGELARRGVAALVRSSVHETAPWPPSDQPVYANAVIAADPGDYDPQALLALLLGVERDFGRERRERWAARTLDLDLLDYDGQIIEIEGLSLPHPRLHERAFVLAPLAEVAGDWRHPIKLQDASELLAGILLNNPS
ncbi:MAG: 2-amino-4-hydroxy-6-hydroxymethyldihydropteridine diphosphokinase [Caulobacterales bacterium]